MQHQQHLEINVGHLKAELVKKLGAERSKLYFFYLNRFLSLKITKVEFNRICFRVLGRENIVLHNQLITVILRNACHAKVPPDKPLDAAGESGDYNFVPQIFNSSLLSNGSHLQPPCKSQSGIHERTNGSFPTPTGGKGDSLFSHSKEIADLSYNPVSENGIANHSTIGKLTQNNLISEDWTGASTRSLLQAPLGVPLCSVSAGGARKALALESSGGFVSSYDCGGLLDSVTLKNCIEQIAVNEGLQGVSLDSANLLNNALDSYLKNLIRSSIEMAAGKGSVSLLDFRVAMEMKPQQLGEDWPLLLEKMCAHSHRE